MSTSEQTTSLSEFASNLAAQPVLLIMRLADVPMRFAQRLIGVKGMPYLFILPNLAFFGIFVLIPLFINFAYSLSGGTGLFMSERPFVGTEQYGHLLNCDNVFDVST
ncbi:MAG: sugar ABC transporter permease, partial [Alphaproteobacteria bacterium]